MVVDHVHDLGDRALRGLTDHRPEFFLAGDDIAEALPKAGHSESCGVAGHPVTLSAT
jgi:hypothetical protein